MCICSGSRLNKQWWGQLLWPNCSWVRCQWRIYRSICCCKLSLLWRAVSSIHKRLCYLSNFLFYRTTALLYRSICWSSLRGGIASTYSRMIKWTPYLLRLARIVMYRIFLGWATHALAPQSFGCSLIGINWWKVRLVLRWFFLYLDGKFFQTVIRYLCRRATSGILTVWKLLCCWLSIGTSKS